MSDLIERQKAIEALDFEIVHMTAYRNGKNEGNPLAQYNKGLEDGIKAIRALPSAEPERKTGTWIYDTERVAGDGWTYSQYHCSECGFQVLGGMVKFCPNCGADMRGEK